MRKDGTGFLYAWVCGEKRYGEPGICDPRYIDPPKDTKESK